MLATDGTDAATAQDAKAGQRQVVRIFQSYGWKDATEISQRLKASLTEAGYDVWLDRENLRADDKHFSIALEAAVKDCQVVVALLSPHSVRGLAEQDERSSICYNEILLAETLARPIVPVRVRKFPGAPPFLIIKYRRIDWLEWEDPANYRKGLNSILATIERVLANDKNFDPDVAFQATNFTLQLNTARDSFVGRDWLFAHLDAWLETKARCLLVEGDTGSGKTAFSAELIRRNPGGRVLAYHFCGATPTTLDAATFVRSIAGMLANGIDAYAEQLWRGTLENSLRAADPQTMLLYGVLMPLQAITMDGNFIIVVDALDEAIGVAGAQISLPLLLARSLDEFPPWLKLMVTTRPHERIQRMFHTAEIRSLATGTEDQRSDVRAYIERRLADPSMQTAVGGDDRTRTAALIENGAAGSFQYASSVLDALARGDIAAHRLNYLPKGLEALYYARAEDRFPNQPDYRLPRIVLGMLLAAREPLTATQLATLTGLDRDVELQPTLETLRGFVGPDFISTGEAVYRISHMSIADWLRSSHAGSFQVDPKASRERLLTHCLDWKVHHELYALKHVSAHLLECGRAADALAAIARGLFAERFAHLSEHRLDADDSRNLALALISARDEAGLLTLARTNNLWQRDGIASALHPARPEDLGFVDQVVGALLKLTT